MFTLFQDINMMMKSRKFQVYLTQNQPDVLIHIKLMIKVELITQNFRLMFFTV